MHGGDGEGPERRGWIARFAAWVIRHRLTVTLIGVALAVALGTQIPRIEADFTPNDLLAQIEGQEDVNREFQAAFGNTDNVVLALVQAPDVLSVDALQYVHDLSSRFRDLSFLERVESITVTPIPRLRVRVPEPAAPAEEGGLGGALGRILGGDDEGTGGLLSGGLGNVDIDPVVDGDAVEQAESDELRRALADAPLLEGRLVSRDRTVTAVVLYLRSDLTRNRDIAEAVAQLEATMASTPPPDGVSGDLAGLPYIRKVIIDKMRADQSVLLPASVGVCLLVLFLSFRWLPAVLVPVLAISLSVVMLVGGMALAGEAFNIINNMVPMLVLIVGISFSIQLVNRYGEELRRGRERPEAARRALTVMVVTLFLVSFANAHGFGALATSATPMLQRFGLTAAFGIELAYLVSITILPAVLSLTRPPRRWRSGAEDSLLERGMARITAAVVRHRWAVLAGSAVFLGLAAFAATRVVVNSRVLDQLDERDQLYQTSQLLERSLQGMRPLEISLSSDQPGRLFDPEVLATMDEVRAWVREQPGVLSVNTPTDYLHEAWYRLTNDPSRREATFTNRELVDLLRSLMQRGGARNPLNAYLNEEGTQARINVMLSDVGAQATLDLIESLRGHLAAELAPLETVDFALTGDAYHNSMGLTVVLGDLFSSLFGALTIIIGVIMIVLRSIRLGLLSIPPNIVPLAGTMAYMALRGIPLNLATVITFSVAVGMAVDGTINLLARFREEIRTAATVDEALIKAARGSGKAIFFTYMALMLGFGVMLLSSFPPVRRFGELISITMAMCLVATVVMIPALIRVGWRRVPNPNSAGPG